MLRYNGQRQRLLSVSGVVKKFAGKQKNKRSIFAVDGVDFSLYEGECLGM